MNDPKQKRAPKAPERPRSRWSWLTRRLLTQYVTAIVLAGAALAAFALGAWWLCAQVSWQEDSPLYLFLRLIRENLLPLMVLCLLAEWLAVSHYFISKPLRYLDELVRAAQELAEPGEEPILLPEAMKDVQDELNLVRERTLRTAALAREAEQRKNDLVVYLAHDLKTPLTSVIGYLTLLRDEPQISPELRAKYTGIALEKAQRLEDLTNEFFEITRFSLTRLTLETCPVDLTRMLEQVASEFEPALAEKNLTCRLDLPRELVCQCDPDKLARVFDNLLRNACHHSFPGGVVEVAGRLESGTAVLTFQNPGRTIPPEKLERIFEQFFRLDSSRGSGSGGAGLGLAIAKEIVELHGGTIAARSAGNLVTFTVALPVGAPPPQAAPLPPP